MTLLNRATLVLSCVLAGTAPAAAAQAAEPCSYDACALRLRYRFLATQLVQGREEHKLASLGWFPPAVPLFGARSDSAARYYDSFRRRHTSGAILSLVGVVAATAGLLTYDSNDDAGIGLIIGGGLLGLGGSIQITRAQDPLSRAIWWFNRTLDPVP